MDRLADLDGIEGLQWEANWRLANGGPSFVVPFASSRPFNVVFHGDEEFSYGHFGIHIGQTDRLTFLGKASQTITAHFLDCRQGSSTARQALSVSFSPTSARTLCIPPGVAHTFDGLAGVVTLNSYTVDLPDPENWLSGETAWSPESDIINLDLKTAPSDARLYKVNAHPASETFYRMLADNQRRAMPLLTHDHPYTVEARDNDGTSVVVRIQERRRERRDPLDGLENLASIGGLLWLPLPMIETGPASGITPFAAQRPYYLVDHGEDPYAHDAFGIHLGQDDVLTFLGRSEHLIEGQFVDCRQGSPTLHHQITTSFQPSAERALLIPRGVAHRFKGLENVYTLNQGLMYLDREDRYEPGHDVTDWPINARPFPEFTVNNRPAPASFYADVIANQQRLRRAGYDAPSPAVFMATDGSGAPVRVSIRAMST